jgi:hypothetical protein
MPRVVPNHQSQVPVLQFEEVVEVATDLASRLVVSRQLPAVEFGGRLGQERPLDLASDA